MSTTYHQSHPAHITHLNSGVLFKLTCDICISSSSEKIKRKEEYEVMKSNHPGIVNMLKKMVSDQNHNIKSKRNFELYLRVQEYFDILPSGTGFAPLNECRACKTHLFLRDGLCIVCSGNYNNLCLAMSGIESIDGLRWTTCGKSKGCPECVEDHVKWGTFSNFK